MKRTLITVAVMAVFLLTGASAMAGPNDLEKLCSDVVPGDGRLKECIDKNMAKVSDRCKRAMKDVGMK
jgi:hypothetical protein